MLAASLVRKAITEGWKTFNCELFLAFLIVAAFAVLLMERPPVMVCFADILFNSLYFHFAWGFGVLGFWGFRV